LRPPNILSPTENSWNSSKAAATTKKPIGPPKAGNGVKASKTNDIPISGFPMARAGNTEVYYHSFQHSLHSCSFVVLSAVNSVAAMWDIRDMPWDWPAEVNFHEAKAFCNWKGKATLSLKLVLRIANFVFKKDLNTELSQKPNGTESETAMM